MKLFMVTVVIRYPTVKTYSYENKVIAENTKEAISKLIQFEMITEPMICESDAIEIEGVIV